MSSVRTPAPSSSHPWRAIWPLVKPYWASEERRTAWALLAAVVALTLGMVYMNVQFNSWYNLFYDALQSKAEAQAYHQLLRFCELAALYIGMSVYAFYLNQMLQIRWRRWMTGRYLRDWLGERTYYHLQLAGNPTDNPDQRISDDLRLLAEGTLGLGLGLLNAVVTLASFVGILWRISGPLSLHLRGLSVVIPGYMVWVALAYAVGGTLLTHLLGRPLVGLNFEQQRREADFRFGMARLRENAEGVALYHGESDELGGFDRQFKEVVANWWRIMKRQKILNFFTIGYNQAAVVFPFVIGLPRFFSGAILLGGLIQISNAFSQVENSLSWFVGAYSTLASWRATTDRLGDFQGAMQEARREATRRHGIEVGEGTGDGLLLDHVSLDLPGGQPLLETSDAAIRPGESLLIRGPSGSGKSTLFRAIAGLWPYGRGSVRWPRDFNPLFLPQRPYLPLGTLQAVVSYPDGTGRFTREETAEALRACGLPKLAGRLDETRPWSLELSPGEQQRIAFARALLHRPAWLFLDEATSALDPELERTLYALLRERLPDTTLVSIGHRPGLAEQHTRTLEMKDTAGGLRQLRPA